MSTEKNYVSEIAVSYSPTYKRKIKINSTEIATHTLRKMWDVNLLNVQEQFCVLFLNRSNQVNGFKCLSTGGIDNASVDIRLLFSIACKSLSTSIIIAHNHPSGFLEPSKADLHLTRKIKKASELMDIQLVDHIILSHIDYFSFAEHQLI